MNLPEDAERVLCDLTQDERRRVLALLDELFLDPQNPTRQT